MKTLTVIPLEAGSGVAVVGSVNANRRHDAAVQRGRDDVKVVITVNPQ
jgi:hypothetical protein